MDRRHVIDDELAALPPIVPPAGWTAGPWKLERLGPGDGHFDDAVSDLKAEGGPADGLSVKVRVTSYDLEGRNSDELVKWIAWKTRDEISTALRRAA